jgi:hypothetical protein
MRSVFPRCLRFAAACLLIAVLVTPTALASDGTGDPSLWAEFLVWLQGRLDIPGGLTADDTGFTVWLQGRLNIPGG